MNIVLLILCVVLLLYVLWEAFETLVLPRRIERSWRGTRLFYKTMWDIWTMIARRIPLESQDNFLAVFGPFSLLLLLIVWGTALIFCFAGFGWGMQIPIHAPEGTPTFGTYLYLSATTFVTLGFGDVVPQNGAGRFFADMEAGLGFGFLAIVISYLPVLYGAFSRREVLIALLDARASSPPSAGALLQRYAGCMACGDVNDLPEFLRDWEKWSAELLESHLSYPILMYYRSQHDRQSWLSALTMVLDVCAFIISSLPQGPVWQARLTFAMARHAAIDLTLVFEVKPTPPPVDRLSPDRLAELHRIITEAGTPFNENEEAITRLNELRKLYEPYVHTLSQKLLLDLPSWLPDENTPDNWQTSRWDRSDHFFQQNPRRLRSRN